MLEGAGSTRGRSVIARTLLDRAGATAGLDRADDGPRGRDAARRSPTSSCPSTGSASTRSPIRFPVTLLLEGTVRGTGGVHVTDRRTARTAVPGPLRRRRRRHPRADLRRVHRRRQPQRGLGDVVGQLGRRGRGPASPGRRTGRRVRAGAPPARPGCDPPDRRARRRPAGGRRAPCRTRCCPYDKNYLRTATGLAAVARRARRGLWRGSGTRSGRQARPVRTCCRAREAAAMMRTPGGCTPQRAGPHRDPRDAQARRLPRPGPAPSTTGCAVGGLDSVSVAPGVSRARAGGGVRDRARLGASAASPATGAWRSAPPTSSTPAPDGHPGDRPPGRLPDLLPVRGVLPGRRAVRGRDDGAAPDQARRRPTLSTRVCSAATEPRSAGAAASAWARERR